MWGGRPRPQPAPWPACQQADGGVRLGPGGPPHPPDVFTSVCPFKDVPEELPVVVDGFQVYGG